MKSILAIFSVLLALSMSFDATAQMSKSESKEWKKRIKSLTPEQYKALLEENKSLKGQLSSLKAEAADFDSKFREKDDQISDYQDQVSSLRKELAEAKKNSSGSGEEGLASRGTVSQKGVLFKVQIGAFKQKDLSKFSQGNPSFEVDSEDGTMRYTIGVFKDYWEADTFKKYLREMGVKDAWIVAYKDGKRVPIKEVLEGVI
ncbi:Ezrin/radixin/moesin family protein [Reichenbachiella agarivorans]|uniref:Ezrin/radixin/moesin family protein n=1 Tax=Reichenbachiella agarivorans TaxID=2979464 RepID=A0ABY6CRD9_9BACT|nr:Ezrin/radixin/moesin family protein [Reichenbachiella agarivorans]UXP33081.1 Ezrin/radixin/moesin family protein [Reichenbachiella agarivorans]